MTNVLALETSGPVCSVCLLHDGNRFEITEHVERRHNELLLGMVDDVCCKASFSTPAEREQIDVIAFGCGPGSFTGVRIAAAATQALALAWDAGVIPVSSSQALARAAQRSLEVSTLASVAGLITSIRSRQSLHYLGCYALAATGLNLQLDDALIDAYPGIGWPDDERWIGVGDRPLWWPADAPFEEIEPATAYDVGLIALSGRLDRRDAAAAIPRYVAGDTPWSKDKKKNKEKIGRKTGPPVTRN